jgi:hypothetical protein
MKRAESYEMSSFERGQVAGQEGEPAPAFPASQTPWDARLNNRGWESGAGTRLRFSAKAQAARHSNEEAKRSSLDQLLPADDFGDDCAP